MRTHRHAYLRRPLAAVAPFTILVLGSATRLSAQAETLGQIKAGADTVKTVIDIIKEVNSARSVVIEVDNNTHFTFTKVSDHHAHGGWATTPRHTIGPLTPSPSRDAPKPYDVFGSQSTVGSVATGTQGEVTYSNQLPSPKGLQFTIKWSNPYAGSNSCDVSVSGPQSDIYRVKATCGSGNQRAHMRYEIFRSDWRRLPGCAKDIGVDKAGVAWVIGCSSDNQTGPGNYVIRRLKGTVPPPCQSFPSHEELKVPGTPPGSPSGCDVPAASDFWQPIDGGGIHLAVEPGGRPWVLNAERKIYKRTGQSFGEQGADDWTKLDGCGRDIGIDQSGMAWLIGCTSDNQTGPGNYVIRRWRDGHWREILGGGVYIAVEPGGRPWLINYSRKIYRRIGRSLGDPVDDHWGDPLPGCANDVGADSMGRAWVIGCSTIGVGYSIHRKNPADASWTVVDGSAIKIAVEPNGRPWLINGSHEIYVRDKRDY